LLFQKFWGAFRKKALLAREVPTNILERKANARRQRLFPRGVPVEGAEKERGKILTAKLPEKKKLHLGQGGV